MKILRLLALLGLSTHSHAFSGNETLLNYYCGNQIYGSYIEVFQDGKVIKRERDCCPSETKVIHTFKLKAKVLGHLAHLLEQASHGQLNSALRDNTLGGLHGSLTGTLDGEEVLIFEIAHTRRIDNDSEATYEILNAILKLGPKHICEQ